MYCVDSQDRVIEIMDVPQSSVGAPCPMILAGEHHLHLAYYFEDRLPDWDGTTVRVVGESTTGMPVALVESYSKSSGLASAVATLGPSGQMTRTGLLTRR